jgi:ribosomal protein S17E
MTSSSYDTIRQKRTQDPKLHIKKQNQEATQIQSKDLLRRNKTRGFITKMFHHPKDSDSRISSSQNEKSSQKEDGFNIVTHFIRSSTTRYQTIFFGLCYSCNNFGHKYLNCRENRRKINNYESHEKNGYPRRPSET